jgi:hypothetical protein
VKVKGEVAFAFAFWTSLKEDAWVEDALKNLVI